MKTKCDSDKTRSQVAIIGGTRNGDQQGEESNLQGLMRNTILYAGIRWEFTARLGMETLFGRGRYLGLILRLGN